MCRWYCKFNWLTNHLSHKRLLARTNLNIYVLNVFHFMYGWVYQIRHKKIIKINKNNLFYYILKKNDCGLIKIHLRFRYNHLNSLVHLFH